MFCILQSIDNICYTHSTRLNFSKANKVKQILSKVLYERVFQNVVDLVNNASDEASQNSARLLHLSMLDIAGFGNFIIFMLASQLRSNLLHLI